MEGHDEMTHAHRTEKIRELNDRLRTTGEGGRIFLTHGVSFLPPETIDALMEAVRRFSDFTPSNDPWSEHDFGQVTVDGSAYFWKIDVYDLNMEFGSPDPADESVSRRAMTIMTAGDL